MPREHSFKTPRQPGRNIEIMESNAPSVEIVDLLSRRLLLSANGRVGAVDRQIFGEDDGEWCFALFHVESPEDVHSDCWEMHPLADEVVCCLQGGIGLVLRGARSVGSDDLVSLGPAHAVIVPRGRWHRFEFEQPTQLLAVTVRNGTELDGTLGQKSAPTS
jgi:hypothetical protein